MRDWMVDLREARGLTLNDAAKSAGCSLGLLSIVERGWTTLPSIALDIARVYGMSRGQCEEIGQPLKGSTSMYGLSIKEIPRIERDRDFADRLEVK